MLLSNYINTRWNSRNKSRYVELGYSFTNIGDALKVSTNDLSNGSNVMVTVKCDYCGNTYEVEWCKRVKSNSIINKDCCNNKVCTTQKSKEVIKEKYNVENAMFVDEFKEKLCKTNLKKYGVENVFESNDIKFKIRETIKNKYGTEYATQSNEIKDKTKNTCLEKYGVPCFLNLDFSGEKVRGVNSPVWKGGFEHHRVERCTYEYYFWRKEVFKRDGYICQKCFLKENKIINAHHILNWKDNLDERYNIDNGITLCELCHMEFHSIYGKKK